MAKNISEKRLKIIAYFLSTIFLLIIIFPLFYIVSLSLQDDSEIYSYPPRLIPREGTSISIVMDYSKLENQSEDELKDTLLKDSTLAMYSTIYELNRETISEVKFYGTMDGKTVFYSRAHGLMLRLQLQFGTYTKARVSSKVLLANGKYLESAEALGYSFDINGLDRVYDTMELGKNSYSGQMGEYLKTTYNTEGDFKGTIAAYNSILLLENYKYYYLTPVYMYKNIPSIQKYSFFAFMFNTVITLVFAIVCEVVICSITAYPLSKLLSKKTSDKVLLYFLVTLMIPFVCIMIPQLILVKSWGMYNNYGGMLITWLYPYPFYIYLFKGFFDRIPNAYFDAARMDGSGELNTFLKICIPMSKPIITLIALQTFVGAWGDFFWYFLVANKPELWTLNVAIYTISKTSQVRQNMMMGLSVVTILPVLIITAVFSKQIKTSIMSSGIKG
ncbi:carbohydrate ABC transporter permease [Ruminiclostridium cellobioparum]|uniref:ABC-type sugar transport system, permease component n=1 Tax=Ruminiclostridium cellobioparum subsp. termitidis CT1112 TaxID=1195236 RepID=S0FIM0_RUMCE|nr:carbohydrate ABC transporter permease [Ruminiclostridium cellobioparum]EMS70021.1 ABC-type sugar transport system, permease component [Ruminiclostridium cellobioparum subsp. termitidis CT1112]